LVWIKIQYIEGWARAPGPPYLPDPQAISSNRGRDKGRTLDAVKAELLCLPRTIPSNKDPDGRHESNGLELLSCHVFRIYHTRSSLETSNHLGRTSAQNSKSRKESIAVGSIVTHQVQQLYIPKEDQKQSQSHCRQPAQKTHAHS